MFLIMLIYGKDDELYVEKLYIDLKDDMLYVANKILHNIEDAEDAVQLAFEKIIKHLQRIQNLQNVNRTSGRESTGYCIVIVKNIAFRMYNNSKSRVTSSIDEVDNSLQGSDNTEELALQNDLLTSIDDILETLPQHLSKPFIMRFYNDMKYPDIGKMLEITPNAAQKRVERVIDMILAELGDGAF